MRPLFSSRLVSGLILPALAAGFWIPPVFPMQQSSKSSAKTDHASTASKGSHSTNSATKKSTRSGKSPSHKKSTRVKGQAAPTPERISAIQEALASKGVLEGTPTGKWDDTTVEAMKKFQSSHGLNPTGKLDALTLQKLGLGSETAGLAPPTPPPKSVNRLRNTSSLPEEPHEQK